MHAAAFQISALDGGRLRERRSASKILIPTYISTAAPIFCLLPSALPLKHDDVRWAVTATSPLYLGNHGGPRR